MVFIAGHRGGRNLWPENSLTAKLLRVIDRDRASRRNALSEA